MAKDVRAPGDISVKDRFEDRPYRYLISDHGPNSSIDPYGPFISNSVLQFRSKRPSYAKGAVVTLPGGDTFRKATAYTHSSVETVVNNMYSCGYYVGHTNILWAYRGAEDYGRDTGTLVATPPTVAPTGIPTDSKNEAVTKALNQIADQKVNLGENLATLGQTVRLFTDRTALLLDALKHAKRIKRWVPYLKKSFHDLDRAGPLTVVAREYLAYVYGLRPLMQDVYNAHKLMKDGAEKTLLFKGVGKAYRSQGIGAKALGPFSNSIMSRVSGEYRSKTKCVLWARIDPNTSSLRAINQLGLLNPLGLAWDLIPYSFCVDWILPIGPVLYALTAPAGLIFVDGALSTRTTETQLISRKTATTSVNYDARKGFQPEFEVPQTLTLISESYVRTTLSSFPIPGLWFDNDPFRGDRPFKALALEIIALSGSRSPIR
jgi:hypothetical protein